MGTSSFIGYLYITFSFLFAKSLVITVLFYRKKRFNMMQPTTRSIPFLSFGAPAESHSIDLCQNIILSIRPKMGTSSFIGYLYIAFSFLFAKSFVITVLFYRKKRFNMMQPTTRSIPNKYHCLSLLFSLPILL